MKTHSESISHTHEVYRITLLGAVLNFALIILKLFAGVWGRSSVLIADAVHSLSDFVTDIAVIIGARYWERPADGNHPYGHAKLETIITLFIGAALMTVGGRLVFSAVSVLHQMVTNSEYEFILPGKIALIAACVSIVAKEFLYRVTARVGEKIHSSAVVANAWHHRSDALSSIPAAFAVGCCLIFGERYAFLDPVATILVGGMIFYAAWQIMYPTFGTLMDAGASEETVTRIETIVREIPGTHNPHKIRTRRMGNGFDVDLHVWVDGNMTVRDSHQLAHEIESRLKGTDGLQILDVIVHVEPIHGEIKNSVME